MQDARRFRIDVAHLSHESDPNTFLRFLRGREKKPAGNFNAEAKSTQKSGSPVNVNAYVRIASQHDRHGGWGERCSFTR
jgi:hypothetical protein